MNAAYTSALPGYAIGSISTACGVSFLEASIGLASVLGGIAGPEAGLLGPAGERIHPSLNLIATGRDTPQWRRAQDLILAPVRACQQMFRDMSQSTSRELLNHLQFGRLSDETHGIVESSKAGLFSEPSAKARFVSANRHVSVLNTPTFSLLSPNAETVVAALPEIMDGEALVAFPDGELLDGFSAKDPGKGHRDLVSRIAAAVIGQDQPRARDKRIGPGRIERFKANLIVTSTCDQVRDLLAGGNADVLRILRRCVFIDPRRLMAPTQKIPVTKIPWGYEAFCNSVKTILGARQSGVGYRLGLKPEANATLHEFTEELQAWLKDIPAHLQPFFSEALTLPYRLHWSFLASLGFSEPDAWVLPFTTQTTRQLLEHQRHLLGQLILDGEEITRQRARRVMLQKLAGGPLILRDLLRRYAVQRRELHEPVLNELIGEGLIRLHDNGLLELCEKGEAA